MSSAKRKSCHWVKRVVRCYVIKLWVYIVHHFNKLSSASGRLYVYETICLYRGSMCKLLQSDDILPKHRSAIERLGSTSHADLHQLRQTW
jgi:hypothetical protein